MSHHQYGPPPDYPYRSATGTRAPVSPISVRASVYAASGPVSAPVSVPGSPTRTKPPRQARAPPPPPHRHNVTSPPRTEAHGPPSPVRKQHHGSSSPSRYRRQSTSAPPQDPFRYTTGTGETIDLPPSPTRPYTRDSGNQAIRDIDNLFGGGRELTPSPKPSFDDDIVTAPTRGYRRNVPSPRYSRQPPPVMQNPMMPYEPDDYYARQAPPSSQRDHYGPPAPLLNRPELPRQSSSVYDEGPFGDFVNPNDLVDDDDDGLYEGSRHHRYRRDRTPPLTSAAGAVGMLKAIGTRAGSYGSLPSGIRSIKRDPRDAEKSEWLRDQSSSNSRLRWKVGIVVGLVLLAAIIGGAVGGALSKKSSTTTKNSTSSSHSSTTSSSSSSGGLYDIDSSEVKALLNNTALHRVFPGMDYTPLNTQYPDCLSVPPDQNNITLDVAMLAQLAPAIRLYGTDCNQTEMLLTAIDRLGYNDTLKVWLGVWLDTNTTTNARQLSQMYDILDTYPSSHFAGVIVGNEVLFREDMTVTELGEQLSNVRSNLTAKGLSLPVATSDLGDDWTSALVGDTDIVMSNVHPFFAGVTPDEASSWAWDFWQEHDVILTGAGNATGGYPNNIISEIGWPSEGGNDCGTTSGCPNATAGSVASVENMNTFMEGWVCQSLANATTYFWFEAFDEPWKVIYNTATDKWESKWGLMDANRNVKDGLKIPDCDGQTIDHPY